MYMSFSHVHIPNFAAPDFCNSSPRGRYGDCVSEVDAAVGRIM